MKNFIKFALIAAVAAGFTSCDGSEEPKYTPAAAGSDAEIYFEAAQQEEFITSATTEFGVMVYRAAEDAADEKVVSIVTTWPDVNGTALQDFFEVPSHVTFEAGATEAEIIVKVAPDAMEYNKAYNLTLGVDPADGNAWLNTAATTIAVTKSSFTDWALFGTGTYTFVHFFEGDEPVKVLYRYDELKPEVIEYQVQWAVDETGEEWETFMHFNTKDGGKVITVPEQRFYYHGGYEEWVMVTDMYTYTGNANYEPITTYNPETKQFKLAVVYYISLGVFGNGYEYIQLD